MANAGKTVFAQFTKVRSIHSGFYKMKDGNQKKFIPQLAIDTEIFHRAFPILVRCETKVAVEALCILLHNWQLGAQLLITVRDGALTLKGSQRMGDGRIFPKKNSAPFSLMTPIE